MFRLLDADDSGTLSKEEFATVMKILYSQVLTRIVIQWSLTLMSKYLDVIVVSRSIPTVTSSLFDFLHVLLITSAC